MYALPHALVYRRPVPSRRVALAILLSLLAHAGLIHIKGAGGGRPRAPLDERAALAVSLEVERLSAAPVASGEVLEPTAVGTKSAPSPRPRAIPVEPHAAAVAAERVPAPQERSAGASDPTYYGAREIDVYPALAGPLALLLSAPARVQLFLAINAMGAVEEVSVVSADTPAIVEDEVLRAFRAATFTPALRNGRAVRSRLLVEVSF